jgi:hypothetical protein
MALAPRLRHNESQEVFVVADAEPMQAIGSRCASIIIAAPKQEISVRQQFVCGADIRCKMERTANG